MNGFVVEVWPSDVPVASAEVQWCSRLLIGHG
jgi:hypothetical protein